MKKVLAVFLAVSVSCGAYAQQVADPGPQASEAEQLSVLQAKIAVAAARKKLRELESAGNGNGGMMQGMVPFAGAPMTAAPMGAPGVAGGLAMAGHSRPDGVDGAKVVAIQAYDGKFLARLSIDGADAVVHRGDVIHGWMVSSIDATRVVLGKGRRVRVLMMHGDM